VVYILSDNCVKNVTSAGFIYRPSVRNYASGGGGWGEGRGDYLRWCDVTSGARLPHGHSRTATSIATSTKSCYTRTCCSGDRFKLTGSIHLQFDLPYPTKFIKALGWAGVAGRQGFDSRQVHHVQPEVKRSVCSYCRLVPRLTQRLPGALFVLLKSGDQLCANCFTLNGQKICILSTWRICFV
jgi:hypothetical protein